MALNESIYIYIYIWMIYLYYIYIDDNFQVSKCFGIFWGTETRWGAEIQVSCTRSLARTQAGRKIKPMFYAKKGHGDPYQNIWLYIYILYICMVKVKLGSSRFYTLNQIERDTVESDRFTVSPCHFLLSFTHRIGWWENLQENPTNLMVKTLVSG